MINKLLLLLLRPFCREQLPTNREELNKHLLFNRAYYRNPYTGEIYTVSWAGGEVWGDTLGKYKMFPYIARRPKYFTSEEDLIEALHNAILIP